jgi:hypothetical protein
VVAEEPLDLVVTVLMDFAERAYANARELHEFGTGSREEFLQTLVLSTIDDVLALAWLEPVYLLRLAEVRAGAVEGRFADQEEVCRFVREHPL